MITTGKTVRCYKPETDIEILYKGCNYIDHTDPSMFVLMGEDEIGEYESRFLYEKGWEYEVL